ncbi:beta-lactamase family protein [Aestuariibacter sp. AA17]|uniref:Beta-lactamase family protein n=1 Tax=Fluctibacter corallii TaxID=2984329 RepID=A0ABT3A7T9_9ALTE|nr:serine hydrolase domain-containing protein [Aestuariibacter sp. AA17]MCV2884347.1 beta-lactamase family protein [Aestuariibacter sp. AA17]
MYKHIIGCLLVLLVPFSGFAAYPTCDALTHLTLSTPKGNMTIKERMHDLGINGLSVALVKDFSVACTFAAGNKDTRNRHVDPSTLFQVASISKPITALAVLKLAEEGQIELTNSPNKYLTRWKLEPSNTGNTHVAITDVLNHTAGINVPSFAGYAVGTPLPTTEQILNGESPSNSPKVNITSAPKQQYQYSGGGYTVLEMLIEDVSKQSFTDYVEASILKPLGMHSSHFAQPLDSDLKEQIALGSSGRLPESGGYFNYPELAAAGMWSNAADVARLVVGIQTSAKQGMKGILTPETTKKMLTPFEDSMSGLGLVIDDMYFSHTGHNNGYVSMMLGHDSAGYGIAVLTSAEQPAIISEIIVAIGKAEKWEDF